ncbi:MAG: beta-aspartyl-peptidase [Clostridiaceae bacterium]|nr:beta-aspartyl-peptidase [Clostridiaceae bacterium]
MLKLWKNCDIYAPAHLGKRDILVLGDQIYKVEPDLSRWESLPETEVLDLHGMTVCPGLVDIHVHVTGGGGEQGPVSRVPEIRLTDLTLSGVTTVLGLLGTDGISRSLENLLFKCRSLEEEGITTRMLTGSYRCPSPTLTGDVMRDLSLIDKVIGVKIALSDHRSSAISGEELARLASEARIGGMLSGKPGLVVMHLGTSPRRLSPLFEALACSDVPPQSFLPAHCCRSPELVAEAVRFNNLGGTIDFTADLPESEKGTSAALCSALRQGADPARVTMSSDGGGSQPSFDAQGNCVGLTYVTPVTLLQELQRMLSREGLDLSTALRFFTENPARVLGLSGVKGVIAPGADADLLALDGQYAVRHLLARGKTAVLDGAAVMKGRFE